MPPLVFAAVAAPPLTPPAAREGDDLYPPLKGGHEVPARRPTAEIDSWETFR